MKAHSEKYEAVLLPEMRFGQAIGFREAAWERGRFPGEDISISACNSPDIYSFFRFDD